jgi:hypothetical protein
MDQVARHSVGVGGWIIDRLKLLLVAICRTKRGGKEEGKENGK